MCYSAELEKWIGKDLPHNPTTRDVEPTTDKQKQILQYAIQHTTKDNERWLPENLVGARILVTWTQSKAKGNWPGTIVDHVRNKTSFWVKYDTPSKDGITTYEEDLLGSNPPNWKFLDITRKSRKCVHRSQGARDAETSQLLTISLTPMSTQVICERCHKTFRHVPRTANKPNQKSYIHCADCISELMKLPCSICNQWSIDRDPRQFALSQTIALERGYITQATCRKCIPKKIENLRKRKEVLKSLVTADTEIDSGDRDLESNINSIHCEPRGKKSTPNEDHSSQEWGQKVNGSDFKRPKHKEDRTKPQQPEVETVQPNLPQKKINLYSIVGNGTPYILADTEFILLSFGGTNRYKLVAYIVLEICMLLIEKGFVSDVFQRRVNANSQLDALKGRYPEFDERITQQWNKTQPIALRMVMRPDLKQTFTTSVQHKEMFVDMNNWLITHKEIPIFSKGREPELDILNQISTRLIECPKMVAKMESHRLRYEVHELGNYGVTCYPEGKPHIPLLELAYFMEQIEKFD